ncbi:Ankyrin repeat and IBR domain-containing protein 1 [Xenoophorus captivus]|uniref:Ankyrin repeat and IBR domain-containing protein 1 n=1 Tax=Xenoophorus captivus TaxID=1517983 RepID=A0ABV0RQ26_9TELE
MWLVGAAVGDVRYVCAGAVGRYHNETSLHLLCMGPQIMTSEGALQPRISRPYEDEQRRTECLQIILTWTGAKLDHGEYESADINATDNKKNTCLHYAAASGMRTSVERGADLFVENENRETPCDCAEKQHHKDLALSLESQMVFSLAPEAEGIEAEYAALDRREVQNKTLRRQWKAVLFVFV